MTETKPIRVMLVDDHAVVRSGLSAFLLAYDDLELVGEASSGERAIQLCQQAQPDVVLMDLMMPGMDGATATGLIREKCPQIQVIALTSFKEKELVEGALQAGAIGYLLKDVTRRRIGQCHPFGGGWQTDPGSRSGSGADPGYPRSGREIGF